LTQGKNEESFKPYVVFQGCQIKGKCIPRRYLLMNITDLTPANWNFLIRKLEEVISSVPATKESESDDPDARASEIAHVAAAKASASSALAALAPGPFGFATILPDLWNVWRIQRQMVSDIAAVYGKKADLTRETMLYCLFLHGAARIVGEVVMEVGERFVVRRVTLRAIQNLIQKLGFKITQRLAKQVLSRWVWGLGAALLAAFTYRETIKVAETAMTLFSSDISFEDGEPKKKTITPKTRLKGPAPKKAPAKKVVKKAVAKRVPAKKK
jgi:uncharacterized protein (DUF697 family)